MKLVIGTDEAGYGPNLGPLTVTATGWVIENEVDPNDLYSHFHTAFCPAGRQQDSRLQVGDSKKIFQPSVGVGPLEESVLPLCFLHQHVGSDPAEKFNWEDLLSILDVGRRALSLPWYQGFDPFLPTQVDPSAIQKHRDGLRVQLNGQSAGEPDGETRFGQCSCILEPAEFNRGCDELGNKASLLSSQTLELVQNLLDRFLAKNPNAAEMDSVFVYCDKHGGRNSYAGILQSFFPEVWVQVQEESREISRYRFRWKDREFQFQFTAKGESYLPIAYASMISKYLREICMTAFNQFWCRRIDGLKPTAGYPLDARRYRNSVEPGMKELGLTLDHWWRKR